MGYQETSIELMFSDGIRQEADFLLQKLYCGMNNQNDLIAAVKERPYTGSGIFILSELERAGYLKRNEGNKKILNFTDKGQEYVASIQKKKKKDVILTDLFKKEEVKLGKLERKLAPAVKD